MAHDLPHDLFANPVWHALRTRHRHFAVAAGDAVRYPAEVTPFAALAAPTPDALTQLASLLAPNESVWLVGESYPAAPELVFDGTLDCLQMSLPEDVPLDGPPCEVVPLSPAHAAEMVALTDVAFPGFFRRRTCEMGPYYGVRSGGALIAMGGERLVLDGYPEISGVCTHPAHRGKGLAAAIILEIARAHRRDGLKSWLHVGCANRNAIQLYLRMGFAVSRKVTLHRVSRR